MGFLPPLGQRPFTAIEWHEIYRRNPVGVDKKIKSHAMDVM
jgi:hypothetical protein